MDKTIEPTKLKAATTYNTAADHFDDGPLAFWDRYGRGTIERLQLKPGSTILDIGCGSGASAIPAAKAVGPHGRAIGVVLPVGDEVRRPLSLRCSISSPADDPQRSLLAVSIL